MEESEFCYFSSLSPFPLLAHASEFHDVGNQNTRIPTGLFDADPFEDAKVRADICCCVCVIAFLLALPIICAPFASLHLLPTTHFPRSPSPTGAQGLVSAHDQG